VGVRVGIGVLQVELMQCVGVGVGVQFPVLHEPGVLVGRGVTQAVLLHGVGVGVHGELVHATLVAVGGSDAGSLSTGSPASTLPPGLIATSNAKATNAIAANPTTPAIGLR
jgi:hypothetical protein